MARDHGKVTTGFWNDPRVRALAEDGRNLLLYLFTCPHSTAAGCFVAPMAYISRDLQWSIERVSQGFGILSLKPFVLYDPVTEVVFIPGWWDENTIENPKVAIHIIRLIRSLPDCALKTNAISNMMRFPNHKEHALKLLLEAFPKGIQTVCEPSRIPEPEPEPLPEPEPEPEPEKVIVAVATPITVPPDDDLGLPTKLVAGEEGAAAKAYNAIAGQQGWPQCQKVTTNRRTLLRARLRDCGGLEGWQTALAKAEASKFLRGETTRGKGHENWKVDIDFFLSEKTFTRLMEGKYDDRTDGSDEAIRRAVLEGSGVTPGMGLNGRSAA